MNRIPSLSILSAFLVIALSGCNQSAQDSKNWPHYLGSKTSSQYSSLALITPENVAQLQVAWTYHSGGADTVNNRSQIQCNPLVINGVLYGVSPTLEVFALDAATGREIWKFKSGELHDLAVSRGLAWWGDKTNKRLLVAIGSNLYALDMATGNLIESFGKEGKVDLHTGLGEEHALKFVLANTPGVVYKNLYILGGRVDEDYGAAPGFIRAFDVLTGELVWVFRTIPQPGDEGYETWEDPNAWKTTGGANSWCGMSLDEEAGIVYVPTGSASYDFWGGNRKGANLYANCLLALDANTGKRIWHFQTVHHDIWDRDLPAPPNLLTVTHNGKKIKAVAQATKSGYVFLFDRKTGEPLFPIEERPVPPSDLPGEVVWPTQPRPLKPAPFVRQVFLEKDVNPYSPDKTILTDSIRKIRTGEMWLPPSQQTTMIFPGYDGGAEWGGAATDNDGILYVNANEMPWVQTMHPVADSKLIPIHARLYYRHCGSCHGHDLKGDAQGAYPALTNLSERMTEETANIILLTGRNKMPAFRHLSGLERQAILAFVYGKNPPAAALTKPDEPDPIRFKMDGYHRFLDSKKMPAISPPWGTLSAIDLNTGEYKWQVPFGDWKLEGVPPTGTENYGGPVVTASGLLFIGATRDEMFRAIDTKTGKTLWETKLPAGGYATPAVYSVNGKQYVVIACGGGKMGTKSGDAYVAFALPD